jgi:starch synthase
MNKMNEISFVCPEIGRWSTVGGLGVMVNELSEGLAAMGEKISVVSPYYDKNRKGQQSYLEQDKEGNFKLILTIDVFVGGVKY